MWWAPAGRTDRRTRWISSIVIAVVRHWCGGLHNAPRTSRRQVNGPRKCVDFSKIFRLFEIDLGRQNLELWRRIRQCILFCYPYQRHLKELTQHKGGYGKTAVRKSHLYTRRYHQESNPGTLGPWLHGRYVSQYTTEELECTCLVLKYVTVRGKKDRFYLGKVFTEKILKISFHQNTNKIT